MADDIRGKVALVTGSAQGLGRGIAQALAQAGAHVLINCFHSPQKAEEVCAGIVATGGSAEVLICSVSDETELKEKVSSRQIDILVNNARRDPYSRPEGVGDGEWFNTLLDTNLTGAYLCARAVAPGMKERRWGRILNVSSVQAYLGMKGDLIPYAVSKAGMLALTRCLATELGEWNITVNTLAPGMVVTENIMQRLSRAEIDSRLARYPIHRAATTAEIAEAAVNTICCGAMTGEVVNINSGVFFPA